MKIIIPMTGKSKRFKEDGVALPKQFLPIGNKTMIEHTIDMFPNESDINFIVSKDDYKNKELEKYFKILSKYNIVEIDYQSTGPGGAVIESKLLETDEAVLINYCDFSNIWDWKNFKDFIKINNPDGVIPAYVGLHPHSIYDNNYAFLKLKNNNVIGIQEKKPFTKDKMNEFASSGSYYFKSGLLAKKYIDLSFKKKQFTNNEIYISTPYQEMINDKLNIKVYEISHFFQWGTPEDYKEFIYCLEEVKNVESKNKIALNNVNLLIPAAGESKRFRDENYDKSKIYLDVNGLSMIQNILKSFKEELTKYILIQDKDFSNKEFTGVKPSSIVKISEKTEGQAESALKLIEKINNDKPLLIHSSDCILDKDTNINIDNFDIVVYTKSNYRRAHEKKENYGWVNSKNKEIKSLSIKSSPESKDSNVIIGTFLFRNKEIYKDLYVDTKKNKSTGEIHIDHLVETALKKGFLIKEVSSSKSIMLGIPVEYKLFNYMKNVYYYLKNK
tara:strand:- start:23006 stop:24505 length:1500 start_codon:yes stop_codon:yes gene_type:complete